MSYWQNCTGWDICSDVTASFYTYFQNISVKANIVENLESCYAVDPFTAEIFQVTSHWPADSAPAPLWRTVVAWAQGRCIFFIKQLLCKVQTSSTHCQNIPEKVLYVLSSKCWQKFLDQKEHCKIYKYSKYVQRNQKVETLTLGFPGYKQHFNFGLFCKVGANWLVVRKDIVMVTLQTIIFWGWLTFRLKVPCRLQCICEREIKQSLYLYLCCWGLHLFVELHLSARIHRHIYSFSPCLFTCL